MVKMKFEGGAELAKTLEALSTRVQKRMLRDALEEAAEPMRAHAASLAPRDPDPIDLRDNIVISTARVKGSEGVQSAAVNMGPAKGFFYGFFQEYGTVHNRAHPFMRPAFDGGASRVVSEMSRALWTALAGRGFSRSSSSSGGVQSEGRFL